MAMKGYSTFPKSPALLGPYHQILYHLISRTLIGGVLLLCREPVGVFYSPSQLGKEELEVKAKPSYMCTFTTPPMNLSRVWFLYISPFSLYLTPPHTLFSYKMFHSVKEKTERVGVSRIGAKMPKGEPEVFGCQL